MAHGKWGPFVEANLGELGIELDQRGLIPLGQARKRVRAAKSVVRGQHHSVAGQAFMPTDFDRLWAALLSLENADEFVKEATRLEWKFHPRGFENIAPVERFGAAIVPWLAHLLKDDGGLPAFPWCVRPCLLAIDTPEALEQLFRVARAEQDKNLVPGWLRRHGAKGQASLDALAARGHAEAGAQGGAAASWLADLDDAMENGEFLLWENTNVHPAAMRVSGFETANGGALVFESLVFWPAAETAFTRKVDAYGPGWSSDRGTWGLVGGAGDEVVSEDQLRLDLDDHSFVDLVSGAAILGDGKQSLEVLQPGGPPDTFTVTVRGKNYTLPVRVPEVRGVSTKKVSPRFALLFQVADRVPRDRLFSKKLATELRLEGARLLFRFDDWRHPRANELPSQSPDLVAMVNALLAGKKLTKLPSKPNANWRHFVRELVEFEGGARAWAAQTPGAQLRQIVYREHRIKTAAAATQFVKKHLAKPQTTLAFEHRAAWALVRTLGGSRTPTTAAPVLPLEARALVKFFLARRDLEERLVDDFVYLLEALLGGAQLVEWLGGAKDARVARCLAHVRRRVKVKT